MDSSMFFASSGSETNATEATSLDNTIRSFYIANGTLRMVNSQFAGNTRNQSSETRSTSIGGGVLFTNYSSVSISSTIFENNYALNGGALFARSCNIRFKNCAFRDNDAGEGDGGALYGHYNSSFDISSSEFSKNRGFFGPGVFSNYTENVNMVNVRVLENNGSRSGGFFVLYGTTRIRSYEFLQNVASRASSALGAISVKLSLKNSTFIGNEAGFGGACAFEANSTVRASSLLFENNTAVKTHGGSTSLFFNGRMRVKNSVFQNSYALSDGGAIYTKGECETILKRVVFLNNTSGEYAGALQIWEVNFTGSKLTFTRNRAIKYCGVISFFEANTVGLFGSHFEDTIAETWCPYFNRRLQKNQKSPTCKIIQHQENNQDHLNNHHDSLLQMVAFVTYGTVRFSAANSLILVERVLKFFKLNNDSNCKHLFNLE